MKANWTTRLLFILIVSLVLLNLYVTIGYYTGYIPFNLYPQLSEPESEVTSSFHDCPQGEESGKKCYQDSWILTVDQEVTVNIVGSKTKITFRPDEQDLSNYHVGFISPITFYCNGKPNENCDLNQPYQLFASNRLVKPIRIEKD